MKISDRVILPLVGSAFQPGKAAEAIERIEDKELVQIAQGEYYFFSAQAERCVETVKDYLDHDDVMLRLSADMLYTFANLTLGVPQTFEYFQRMQARITRFVCENSNIKPERYNELAMNTGELVLDVGTVLDGEDAVKEGLIDNLGSFSDALDALYAMIDKEKKAKKKTSKKSKT